MVTTVKQIKKRRLTGMPTVVMALGLRPSIIGWATGGFNKKRSDFQVIGNRSFFWLLMIH